MHIDTEIDEVEEDPMEASDDESAKDETYRMSPMPPSENNVEEDDESNDSWAGHEAIEEEEGRVRGLSIPILAEGIPLTLVPPSASYTSLCSTLWQITREKVQQR
jgi:hypothetical protein